MAEPFYAEGLRFSCSRCSICCRGEPGFVFLSVADAKRLMLRFDLDFKTFFRNYCTLVDTGEGMALSLSEKPGYDCVFWGEVGCSVYNERPVQCSTYPFWSSIVESAASWRDEAHSCPGIGAGELRTRSFIEECLFARRRAGTLVLSYGVDPECSDEDTILGSEGIGSDSADAIQS